ncbi:hypothetical protein Cch01nite_18680 [Cellulomonas chitinilytica]|uniref:Uncharacterized protein n=1 Tax=Cellulomonas chitinilytica TaxID=398759 RepID=A0A919U2I5_9CELL|nr:hypothetical protein [Cellulomonas chitinilytica]GIG21144.1 hypothetical protein Cch01nite_18680 [Cellulomonas chitinilytica]
MTDERTVGELLLDVGATARDLMWDPNPDRAPAQARSWGEVVEAAAELWAAIPGDGDDPSIGHVVAVTEWLHRRQQRTGWPGVGEGDAQLEGMARNLERAAALLTAVDPARDLSEAEEHDAQLARMRTMHAVYVTAHAVGVSVNQHERTLRRVQATRESTRIGQSVEPVRELSRRLCSIENTAREYLRMRGPANTHGERSGVRERLERAIARWDVQAHRSLATRAPEVTSAMFVAMFEREMTLVSEVVSAAAARHGLIDPVDFARRQRPAMSAAQEAWGHLRNDLARLAGRVRVCDDDLLVAGTELRSALRGISAQLIVGHGGDLADLRAVSQVLMSGLEGAAHRASVVQDVVTDPSLQVSARAANSLVRESAVSPEAPVHPNDVARDTRVPLPPEAAAAVAVLVRRVVSATALVESATSTLSHGNWATADPPITGRSAWSLSVEVRGEDRRSGFHR